MSKKESVAILCCASARVLLGIVGGADQSLDIGAPSFLEDHNLWYGSGAAGWQLWPMYAPVSSPPRYLEGIQHCLSRNNCGIFRSFSRIALAGISRGQLWVLDPVAVASSDVSTCRRAGLGWAGLDCFSPFTAYGGTEAPEAKKALCKHSQALL